jgi:hypothetical protein
MNHCGNRAKLGLWSKDLIKIASAPDQAGDFAKALMD